MPALPYRESARSETDKCTHTQAVLPLSHMNTPPAPRRWNRHAEVPARTPYTDESQNRPRTGQGESKKDRQQPLKEAIGFSGRYVSVLRRHFALFLFPQGAFVPFSACKTPSVQSHPHQKTGAETDCPFHTVQSQNLHRPGRSQPRWAVSGKKEFLPTKSAPARYKIFPAFSSSLLSFLSNSGFIITVQASCPATFYPFFIPICRETSLILSSHLPNVHSFRHSFCYCEQLRIWTVPSSPKYSLTFLFGSDIS